MSKNPNSTPSVRRWLAAALVLAAGWLAGPAFAGDRGPGAAQQTPAALYHNYCSVCHGDQGDGNSRARGSLKPPPRDFTSFASAQELTRERMIAAVTNGVPGTAMVGWRTQLSNEQIGKVVDYVRDTFMRPSVAADASRGRQVYARICSVCHGDRGSGSMWASANLNPPPRDFSAPAAKTELTRDRMLAAVAAGRPNTAMQAYGNRLSKEDMEAVVDYIRGAFMRIPEQTANISGTYARGAPAPEQAPVHAHGEKEGKIDMRAPMPQGLVGDAAAGKKFYDANCATCHGVKGDGQGPRAYFINPKPEVFIAEKSRATFNRPFIFDAVSTGRRGTEMPAWDKVLTKQEIANVSEYVFRAFIQPGSVNAKK